MGAGTSGSNQSINQSISGLLNSRQTATVEYRTQYKTKDGE